MQYIIVDEQQLFQHIDVHEESSSIYPGASGEESFYLISCLRVKLMQYHKGYIRKSVRYIMVLHGKISAIYQCST